MSWKHAQLTFFKKPQLKVINFELEEMDLTHSFLFIQQFEGCRSNQTFHVCNSLNKSFIQDFDSRTPLHLAASAGHINILYHLGKFQEDKGVGR